MKRIKVVVDTQVFIRSWFMNNYFYCDVVIDLVNNKEIYLVFSQDSIGELFHITKNFCNYFFNNYEIKLEVLQNLAQLFLESYSVNTLETNCNSLRDNSDEMFLKTAIKSEADFLISDDFRSGIHGVQVNGLRIVSAEEFVSIYEGLVK